ncbi:hypothetical protein MSAN_00288500 [Mycena sanguinolenta]|uniref:Uncharacterized protein n=1 Tax=Mycena sanguinolenta TaxID=230812 RepID=A0A8H6ZD44_9AGAR|nr:hypothetical protein MSAN_00288500 [Mycena sanguinolenta]
MLIPAFTLITFFSSVGFCKLYEDVADLPSLKYDFVIVGGGTAGPVVANHLTEDSSVSVLVLEAGPPNVGVLDVQVSFLTHGVANNGVAYSWMVNIEHIAPRYHRLEPPTRSSIIRDARYILGGCSSQNGMVYTRGAAEDFDRYAKLTGDEVWWWNQIFPYFLKNERWVEPADRHDTEGKYNPGVHGTDGPIQVSLSRFTWSELKDHVIQTTNELPDDFPFNLDMNPGKPLGIGSVQYTIGDGGRSSSATGYFMPDVLQRLNLHVLLHAQVSKLINPTQTGIVPTESIAFQGVEFKYGSSLFVAEASKEIILSAGVIGTPQILMNSGIGDHIALEALGISTVLNLLSIGKNASEHSFCAMSWAVNSNQTLESITRNPTRYNEAFAEWNRSRTGPFVNSPSSETHVGWLQLSDNSSVFNRHPDPLPGPDAPHFEILFERNHMYGQSDQPADPFAAPLIDIGLFSNEFDALALTEGIQLALKFVSAPTWNGYLGVPTVDLTSMSPAERTTHIRANSGPGYHVVGTAGMSPQRAQYGWIPT